MNINIYGTIGPACCDTDTLARLFEKGMTGIRINLSHSELREASGWLDNVRLAWERYLQNGSGEMVRKWRACKRNPEILMDLRGPELRTGRRAAPCVLEENGTVVLAGEDFSVGKCDGGGSFAEVIGVPAPVISSLEPGQEILLDDGKILLKVEEVLNGSAEEVFRGADSAGNDGQKEPACRGEAAQNGGQAEPVCCGKTAQNDMHTGLAEEFCQKAVCRVLRGGTLYGGKSIALPGGKLHPPTLTESDRENLRAAREYGITGVMLPFVRDSRDLLNLRQELRGAGAEDIRIFAKIENTDGVRMLSGLLPHCDEIVIARGDLGNAVPLWRLPVLQAQIAACCRAAGKPFMVVTQMLASMQQTAVPTRAEVSDIFRAAQEGAASVMLTGETAVGKYPVEAMEYLVKTVREAERYIEGL